MSRACPFAEYHRHHKPAPPQTAPSDVGQLNLHVHRLILDCPSAEEENPPAIRASIHRGTKAIGGICAELESQGNRIVLAIGLPLDVADQDTIPLHPIKGFDAPDPNLLGVVISDPHQDHFGPSAAQGDALSDRQGGRRKSRNQPAFPTSIRYKN